VAYYRVSTDKQGQSGLGLDAQRAAVELHARSVGAEVVAEFQDVESGRKADRIGLAEALATCRAKRATPLIAKLDRLARSVAFISNLMEGGVDFIAADMPSVNRLTVHVLAAVAEHEREMISQRTKAALAAAKVRGTRLGNPRLPATGTLTATPVPSTASGVARVASAQTRAAQAYAPAVAAARAAGTLSLGDYAQALQAARLPAPRGGDRWSRASVARVLRYCMLGNGDPDPGPNAGQQPSVGG
jgi:DNA invertase Pin-like site-specific DNA recombinase